MNPYKEELVRIIEQLQNCEGIEDMTDGTIKSCIQYFMSLAGLNVQVMSFEQGLRVIPVEDYPSIFIVRDSDQLSKLCVIGG